MSDSKVYMFPESGTNNLLTSLVPMLSQRGIDPNVLLAMNNRDGAFGSEGGWFMWILFLFFFGWGGNGFGNGFGRGGDLGALGTGYLSNQLNNDLGRDLLMQAIQGNGNAINQLASTLNCSIGDIQTAINGVMASVQNVGNQVGMSSMQVINAIQAGNCQIGNQLAQCCCDLKSAIKDVAIGQERGFASVAYETQRQTCDIEKAIAASTAQIMEGQRAAEMRDLQDKLDALREKNAQQAVILNNAQQTSQFAAMLAPLQADLAELKCNQVPVKKIACPETYLPVNNSINATYGLIPTCGFNTFGGWNAYNNGCCNNSLWG